MGNKIRSLIPCFCKYKFNSPKIDEGSLDDDDKIKLKENTKFEFYCPECEKNEEIAEILKIYSDNGKMKIKCPNKPKEFVLSFEDYCAKIENKIKKPCEENGKNEVKFFCLGCKKYFHEKGKNKHIIDNPERTNKFVKFLKIFTFLDCITNKCINPDDHQVIDIKEISSYCLEHKIKTTECCRECRKNVCTECSEKCHKWHKIKDINYNEIMNARNTILQKGNKLLKMIEFYDMIRTAYEKDKNNEAYKNNLKTVSECIENEKKRERNDVDLAIYRIEQLNNGIEINLL